MALTKNLMSQIPRDFYRLFGSKYMDYYMTFLVAICEESSRSGSTLGLTEQECRTIINEKQKKRSHGKEIRGNLRAKREKPCWSA